MENKLFGYIGAITGIIGIMPIVLQFKKDMTLPTFTLSWITIIAYFICVISIVIYIAGLNKKIKKLELHKQAFRAICSSRDGESSRLFREEFGEKGLKKLGFKEDEINKIIGGTHGMYMAEVVPHYRKYIE